MTHMRQVCLVVTGVFIFSFSAIARDYPAVIPLMELSDGTRYENVRYEQMADPDNVLIRHKRGMASIAIKGITAE